MRLTTSLVLAVIALGAWAVDLPKMSYVNENKLLKTFPLQKATKEEVYNAYGPPEKRLTGLPYDGETWTYSQGSQSSKEFTFEFRGDLVHDVIVRYRVGGFKQRSARQMQGAK